MNDDDQNRIVQQLLRTNISGTRNELFWYDAQNLPDSLLIEILARLPLKSIFIFKSVCKHWQSLISHSSFSRFYHSILNSNSNAAARNFRILERYTDVPNFKEFLNRLAPEIHSLSEFSVLFLSTPEEQGGDDQIRVLDMSNSLILCCSWSPTPFVYHICDLLTRLWITIPRCGPRILHRDLNVGLITRVNEDHMLTGYTVVRVEILDSQSNYLMSIEMFSSETRKCINYVVPCVTPIQLGELDGGPIQCYGALHWPVRNDEYEIYGMLAFDPYKDPTSVDVRLIPLPEDRVLEGEYFGVCQLCGESQGTLHYFEVAHHDPTEFYSLTMTMWAMKDYEKGEWCREFKVRRSDIHSSNRKLRKWLLKGWFLPLSFHPMNANVVYLSCMEPQCIVSYDVLNRRLDVACKRIDFGQHISSHSGISFVLPRWPVLVSNASVNSKINRIKCRK